MKRIVLGLMMAVSLMVSTVYADGPSNNINFFFGQKTLETDDWGDFDQQAEFGILCDFRGQDWPVSIAVELIGSAKEEGSLTGSTGEFAVGVKKIWESAGTPIRPFVGVGLSSITAKFEEEFDDGTLSSDGTALGYFVEGGVYFTVGENLNIGALVRYSYASVTIDDVGYDEFDINAGGTQTGIFIGYHW
jgi:opacity protein-like surface antigen